MTWSSLVVLHVVECTLWGQRRRQAEKQAKNKIVYLEQKRSCSLERKGRALGSEKQSAI
jgi:hypothetical protein